MKNIGVIGDLHLNKLSKRIPNHMDLQLDTLRIIIGRMRDEGIKNIVFLGDVLDSPIVDTTIIIRFMAFLDQYKDMYFDWVGGNHDKTSTDTTQIDLIKFVAKLGAASHLSVHIKPTRKGGIGFLPYPYKKPLKGTFLTFAHVDRPEAKRDNGTSIRLEDQEWNEDHYFVIGHIHTSQTIRRSDYIGSPYQLSHGEKPDKYWAIVQYSEKLKKVRVKRIPITPSYTLHNLIVESKNQLDQVLDAPNYYKLTIKPGVVLPDNWLIRHPNCHLAGSLPRAVSLIEDERDSTVAGQPIIDVKYGLDSFLEKKGLSTKQIAWANRQVDKVATPT